MAHATFQDDGLDACYQMTEVVPPRRTLPRPATLVRGAGYALLIVGALAVGLLAMQPGGMDLDKMLGSSSMTPGRADACCSQLKLEIPSEATPEQLAGE